MVSQIIYLEKRIYSKIITIKMFKFIIKKIHLAIFRLISIFLPYLRFLRFQSLLINQLNTIRLKSNDSQNLNRLISKLNLKQKQTVTVKKTKNGKFTLSAAAAASSVGGRQI